MAMNPNMSSPQLPYQATALAQPYAMQPMAMPGSGPVRSLAPHAQMPQAMQPKQSATKWMWWVLGLLVLGAVVGAVAALVFK